MVWIVTDYGFFDLGFRIRDLGFRIWDFGLKKADLRHFMVKIFLAKALSSQR